MLVTILSVAAIFVVIIAYGVYYFDIRNSKISPNRFSWLIWSFSASLETITYSVVSQDFVKSICFYISSIICIGITIKIWHLSKHTKVKKTEKISLIFCTGSLLIWIIFNSAWFAHLFLLVAIPIAFIPTLKGAIQNYQNENSHAWILWSISDIFVLGVIITRLDKIEELPYAMIELICHFSVFAIVTIKKLKSGKRFVVAKYLLQKK